MAIVTGAARERGIGRAAAIRLARAGCDVVITDIARSGAPGVDLGGQAELEETAALCRDEGADALAIALDVTDAEEASACARQVVDRFGRIDILFNNAGTPVGVGEFTSITDAHWDLSWAVNVMGMVHMIRAVAPEMRRLGGGSIVNNASMAGLGAVGNFAAYTTTKFAVVGLTKSAAIDFGPDGIRVNAVCPGLIRTQMGDREVEHFADEWGVSREVAEQKLAEFVAIGRWGTPEEVADAVAWLVSDGARYISGVALPVAGGLAPGL